MFQHSRIHTERTTTDYTQHNSWSEMLPKPYLLGNVSSTSLVFFGFDHTGDCGPVSVGYSVRGERKAISGAHQRTQVETEILNHWPCPLQWTIRIGEELIIVERTRKMGAPCLVHRISMFVRKERGKGASNQPNLKRKLNCG
jgi:hypothetical protein